MSVQAMSWVFDYSKSEGIDRLVLLVLANHYNHQTGQCDPGYRRIAAEARVSTSTVGRSVARLVELGELEIELEGSGHRTTKYHCPWAPRDSAGPAISVPQRDASQDLASRSEALVSREGGPSVPPERDRSLKQNHEPRAAASRDGGGGSKNHYDSLPSAREIDERQNLGVRADPEQQSTGLRAARDALALARAKTRPAPIPELELELDPADSSSSAAQE